MQMCLVSEDGELSGVCREFVSSLPGAVLRVESGDRLALPFEGDVYVWDFRAGARIPFDFFLQDGRKHFFVVHRPDLEILYDTLPFEPAGVILRPVSCVTLKAFLGQACAAAGSRAESRANKTQRDDLLQALIETNFKMQQYDQERTNFLARTVHDFRAPLSALTGYCGMLAEQLGSVDDDKRELLDRMQRSANRLCRMADALFRLSTAGHVDHPPRLEVNEIGESVDQALHEVAPLMLDKGIAVSVDLLPPPRVMLFEREQIEQVLINLLDNASKFTPRGGAIRIHGNPAFWDRRLAAMSVWTSADRRGEDSRAPNVYQIDVEDSGPGIPDADLLRIFEEYTSCGGSQDRSGAGLGLAICKLIIKQHKGRIWAANQESRGARFSFVLPLSPGLSAGTRVCHQSQLDKTVKKKHAKGDVYHRYGTREEHRPGRRR